MMTASFFGRRRRSSLTDVHTSPDPPLSMDLPDLYLPACTRVSMAVSYVQCTRSPALKQFVRTAHVWRQHFRGSEFGARFPLQGRCCSNGNVAKQIMIQKGS